MLNGKIINNIYDLPYDLNERRSSILRLIVRNTNSIIAENKYLVFGTSRYRSRNLSRFGLVHISKIVGKVKPK